MLVGDLKVDLQRMKCFWVLLFALGLSTGWAQHESCKRPQAADNLAKHAEATQSSLWGRGKQPSHAKLAIDGNTASAYGQGSCAHTENDRNAWWRLNFGKVIEVGVVVITNRKDCCEKRLLGAEIRVGGLDNDDTVLCGTVTNVESETLAFCCNGLVGQYLTVTVPGRPEYLTLCEVEVYQHVKKEPENGCSVQDVK
ncbi:pentraxin fusion protein-like [Discoglossus pictus]